ncbi:MAG TPA: hypothetical protein PL009_12440 [Flavipsychrobacter sp.]|nr:hypothetical protein [Flavipsychrobacter sp.]
MVSKDVLDILSKFRYVDKYESFKEVLPSVIYAPDDQKNTVSEILDGCCDELIGHFRTRKKPIKATLRQSLIECMDALAIAKINSDNREFGYLLGWYLAEKVNVNLKKGTEKKLWGYWHVEGNEVKAPVKPRIAPKVKEKRKASSTATSELV